MAEYVCLCLLSDSVGRVRVHTGYQLVKNVIFFLKNIEKKKITKKKTDP